MILADPAQLFFEGAVHHWLDKELGISVVEEGEIVF